jgi:hypothetical protein
MRNLAISFVVCLTAITGATTATAQDARTSFFVTSHGPGDGANLGGLEGADAHCRKLAEAAGIIGKTWRAYLSTATVNARDRIGRGPWYNVKGVLIARSVADLHGPGNRITKQTALTETGAVVNGRGDRPNKHDILTGSTPQGRVVAGKTCNNWTSNASTGTAIVGHHDRRGLRDDAPSKSWNASHPTRGCGEADLPKTGGAGLLYCFAAS